MAVDLSIENVPDEVVERLAIVEEAVRPAPMLSPDEVLAEVRRLGLCTPAEAAAIVRADRGRGRRRLGAGGPAVR